MKLNEDARLEQHAARTDAVEFRFQPYARQEAKCYVRIYRPAERAPVVLITELPENEGVSVTNAIQTIVGELEKAFDLPASTVWVEHYTDRGRSGGADAGETFDQVWLGDGEDGRVEPRWKRLGRETFFALLEGSQAMGEIASSPPAPRNDEEDEDDAEWPEEDEERWDREDDLEWPEEDE